MSKRSPIRLRAGSYHRHRIPARSSNRWERSSAENGRSSAPATWCRYIGAVAAVGVGHPDHKRDFELVFADLGGERQVVRAAEEIAVVVDLFAVVGEVNSDGVAVGKTCQDRIDDLVVVAGSVVVVRDDLAFLLRQILAANIPGREIRLLLGVAVGIADVLSH